MVAIPAEAARQLDIREGDEVVVVQRESELAIQPRTTLRKLLDSWDPLGPPVNLDEAAEWFRQDRESH